MIHTGDCIEVMAQMEPESVDAIVTDPPYGLEFMGKEWDRLQEHPRSGGGFNKPGIGDRPTKWTSFGQGGPAMGAWHQQWAEAAYRVAKPSAYLLAFGGTRTFHRLACALEDAGWIIRDTLVWGYASGFPKSKASLKPAWEPIVMARKPGPLRELAIDACRIGTVGGGTRCNHWPEPCTGHGEERSQSGPTMHKRETCSSDALKPWWCVSHDQPWPAGTVGCQRPAGRWPANIVLTDPILGNDYSRFFLVPPSPVLSGTMGTCDRCGVPGVVGSSLSGSPVIDASSVRAHASVLVSEQSGPSAYGADSRSPLLETATAPRPVQTKLDGMPESMASEDARSSIGSDTSAITTSILPEPQPDTASPSDQGVRTADQQSTYIDTTTTTRGPLLCEPCVESVTLAHTLPRPTHTAPRLPADEDDHLRILIVPKADRADREPVLGGLPEQEREGTNGTNRPMRVCQECGRMKGGAPGNCQCGPTAITEKPLKPRANVHPTVKPTDLMRHLVRLVTPAGGVVLDPFLGSGTTAIAAEMEGFGWIGIEREAEYVAIAEARLNGTQRGLGLDIA